MLCKFLFPLLLKCSLSLFYPHPLNFVIVLSGKNVYRLDSLAAEGVCSEERTKITLLALLSNLSSLAAAALPALPAFPAYPAWRTSDGKQGFARNQIHRLFYSLPGRVQNQAKGCQFFLLRACSVMSYKRCQLAGQVMSLNRMHSLMLLSRFLKHKTGYMRRTHCVFKQEGRKER